MATPTYNIDQIKKNANTGTTVRSPEDLQKYGIDYSQAQRDAIANIFANQATTAYGTAQNQYANNMAQQQASLQDTIRRSQAQAVATGASKGMQAANELSSILGLQEQAAQGATELQGTYADALAKAQQQAIDVQNARAQIGAEIAAADIAGKAQEYSVGLDYQANDPYRILSEIAALRASGNNAGADALLTNWLASSGATESQTASNIASSRTNPSDPSTWNNRFISKGLVDYKHSTTWDYTLDVDGTPYGLEVGTKQAADSAITKAVENAKIPVGTTFAYETEPGKPQLYVRTSSGVYRVGGQGDDDGKSADEDLIDQNIGGYNQALTAVVRAGLVLKASNSSK